MKVTHVDLVYYRETGKYYAQGEIDLPYVDDGLNPLRPIMFHEALDQLRAMFNRGERPGLVNGFDFHVLATVYTEYGPLTHLFIREEGAPL